MQKNTQYALLIASLALGLQGCNTIQSHVCGEEKVPENKSAQPAKPAHSATKSPESAPATKPTATTKSEASSKPAAPAAPAVVAKVESKTEPASKPAAPKTESKASSGTSSNKPVSNAAKSESLTREQALALAAKSNCLICHKIDSKMVGPAWKDIGAKYKGDANAAATIAANIKKGGSYGWKIGSMPPNGAGRASEADIASLAAFIASLK